MQDIQSEKLGKRKERERRYIERVRGRERERERDNVSNFNGTDREPETNNLEVKEKSS